MHLRAEIYRFSYSAELGLPNNSPAQVGTISSLQVRKVCQDNTRTALKMSWIRVFTSLWNARKKSQAPNFQKHHAGNIKGNHLSLLLGGKKHHHRFFPRAITLKKVHISQSTLRAFFFLPTFQRPYFIPFPDGAARARPCVSPSFSRLVFALLKFTPRMIYGSGHTWSAPR